MTSATNDHHSWVEMDLELLPCENCGTPHPPSVYAVHLDTGPSGMDLFGVFECPNCEVQYGLAFEAEGFVNWYNREMLIRAAGLHDDAAAERQRWRSQMGREVARFRRRLEALETVEDMWPSK